MKTTDIFQFVQDKSRVIARNLVQRKNDITDRQVYLVGVVFFLAGMLHLLTGYADNGDFLRSISFILEKPVGLSIWPESGTEEWRLRFFKGWNDKWEYLADRSNFPSLLGNSSYRQYFLFQTHVHDWLFRSSGQYSIMAGSIVSRLIFFLGILKLFFYTRDSFSKLAWWVFVALIFIVFMDVSWIAFLNSFYQEQMAVIFFPLLLLLLYKLHVSGKSSYVVMFLLVSALIGAAKPQYFYLPLLSGIFCAIFCRERARMQPLRYWLLVFLMQIFSLLPVVKGGLYGINAYNALYMGALTELPREEIHNMDMLGDKKILKDCIGVPPFVPDGHKCLQKVDASYFDVFSIFISYPSIPFKMMGRSFSDGKVISPPELSKNLNEYAGFSDIPIYNIAAFAFSKSLTVLILLVFCLALTVWFLKRDKDMSISLCACLVVGIFSGALGFSQYAAALGDGYYDLSKHLMIGNYALALSFAFLAPSLLSLKVIEK